VPCVGGSSDSTLRSQKTNSLNAVTTGHDGVCAIEASDALFASALSYNRTHKNIPGSPINSAMPKGMTFDRTLGFPHGPLKEFLKTGKIEDAGNEIPKLYVAVTPGEEWVLWCPTAFP
jgi:DNA helicase II / ATP-dependent DNA helicase PcrA